MTAPLRRSTPHSQPHAHAHAHAHPHPHSQLPASASQSAPVAEFRCLYTPDVRKKQKKWHDGYLKFHAFNNRVMVYDHARNFLGDTYFKDSDALHEGHELTLDKGVMVEVAEPVGLTHTDLTPLFEKKPRDPPPPPPPPPPSAPPPRFHPPSLVARPPAAPSHAAPAHAPRINTQPRHKSLSTLLGTPKGPIGKSVPIQSPYDARQEKEKENDVAVDRAAKRLKITHRPTTSATLRLSSPVQEESATPNKSLPPWTNAWDANTPRQPARPTPRASATTLEELDDIVHISPGITMPSTPPAVVPAPTKAAVTPTPSVRPATVEKPALQTPRIPRGKVPVPSVKALETPRVHAPPSSPPVSASNRLTNVDFAMQPTPAKESQTRPAKQPSPPPPAPPPQSSPRQLKAKSLRLSAGVKRGTLMMCQPPPLRPKAASTHRTASPRSSSVKAPGLSRRAPSPIPEHTLFEPPASKVKQNATPITTDTGERARTKQTLPDDALDACDDDQEVFHGLMDQQLMISPVSPGTPPDPIVVPDRPGRTELGSKERAAARNAHGSPSPGATEPVRTTAAAQVKRKPIQKPQPARKPSPPALSIAEAPSMQNRAASPALSAVSDSRSRTASMSPRKLASLSTGGFRKKPKRTAPQPTPVPDKPPPVPRNETMPLPPHPLRANKKGPVMTTTELAAMLQKPKKRPKVTLEPIEDDGTTVGKSPDRKFRRVRSESDAPIPSTSDDWEKRNLPKPADAPADAVSADAVETPERPAVVTRKKSGLAALVKKTDPRRKLVRTQSLNVDTSTPPAQDTESPLPSPVVDKDVGPWSTEAADLFDWRPPRSVEVEVEV
ncbi:hypothetical protein ST47_g7620 [Ascochyta rabiei]|uniref:5'-3' DNA helicase ZGRF1-like N-terminal domain-containing protein n=1 Tax=Didymella rabiei TaxID=5454 RepID=A0A163AMZ5_DIDRA|nr:hypothetical protein ST47_g7620 [Ascochyta rabiei]